MFVTTAIVGSSSRNEASLSSASATMKSPRPSRTLVPELRMLPPIATVGSRLASSMISAISPVVVVLPCVPATATPSFAIRSNSPSISARAITGILSSRARETSGFENLIAEEMTTASMPLSALR